MSRRLPVGLDVVVGRIERTEALDRPAAVLTSLFRRPLESKRLRSTLSGTPLGHPAHPLLVALPMGAWLAAGYLDATGGSAESARNLVGAGLVTAVPAALTGGSDLFYTDGAERRVGIAHAATNWVAIGLFAGSWAARKRGLRAAGIGLSAAGTLALGAAGWLGGHLTYARGVGVDTTAFEVAPHDWVDVVAEADLAEHKLTAVDADGVPVLLFRRGAEIQAMSDRCTHRGAPLHEGSVNGTCVVCPWHESEFSFVDGHVAAGPATRPQPLFEVRTRYGQIQVRRHDEVGSLRTNPVT